MNNQTYNVLFLCTGNSARSILGEALVNELGGDRFRGFSAGSYPKGEVHPMALNVLREAGFETEGLRSKSWSEFSAPGAPQMNFVLTVCDNAAGESCPIWPGHPMTAHWGIPDPAAVEGDGQKDAFLEALGRLRRRIEPFLALPLDEMSRDEIAEELRAIGRTQAQAEGAD